MNKLLLALGIGSSDKSLIGKIATIINIIQALYSAITHFQDRLAALEAVVPGGAHPTPTPTASTPAAAPSPGAVAAAAEAAKAQANGAGTEDDLMQLELEAQRLAGSPISTSF